MTMRTRCLPLFMVAAVTSGCELAVCDEGAVANGGMCFPEALANGGHESVCGNSVCERKGVPKEDAASCPDDCDGGYGTRAAFLKLATIFFYNDHIVGMPGGPVNASGPCRDGGSAQVTGSAARLGDDNVHNLTFTMTACSVELSALGAIRITGEPVHRNATFNNTNSSESGRIWGNATLSGSDGPTAYQAESCAFDFTWSKTGTTTVQSGDVCGKPLRSIIYDDG